MKLKIVVVDFEIPMRVKKWAIRAGIPAVILTVAAVAWADSLHTWATNDTLQASDLNGNFTNLQAQITALQKPASAFRAHDTQGTTVADNTPINNVVFDSVDFDLSSGSEYSKATGVFIPKNAGTYLLTCSFEFAPTATTGWITAQLFRNGGELDGNDVPNVGSDYVRSEVSTIANLNGGDSITCGAYQNSNSNLSVFQTVGGRNSFSAARLY